MDRRPAATASWNELAGPTPTAYFNLAYHGRNNRELKEKFATLYRRYFRDLPEPTGSGCRSGSGSLLVTQRHQGFSCAACGAFLERLDRQDF